MYTAKRIYTGKHSSSHGIVLRKEGTWSCNERGLWRPQIFSPPRKVDVAMNFIVVLWSSNSNCSARPPWSAEFSRAVE